MRIFGILGIIAAIYFAKSTQGQEYIITGAANPQFISNYPQSPYNPFRSSSNYQQIDSYLPQRDLQTSDLPYHLQQTLPQYRITTKSPPLYTFQPQYFRNSQPAPFRPQDSIIPSTHRPNYSHLFSHSHNRNPQETETFLGEITLQSPAELPPQYNDFKPSAFNPSQSQENVNQNIDITDKPNTVQIGGRGRGNFLNHRTRILAPDLNNKKATLVKDYFVNNNGDVFITTKTPFVPKPTLSTNPPTTVYRRNPFSPTTKPTGKPISFNLKSNKKPFIPKNPATKNGQDLEPLLEEPIKTHSGNTNNDDVVEIIKSKSEPTTEKHEESTTDYDYDTTLEPSADYHQHESKEITEPEEPDNLQHSKETEEIKSNVSQSLKDSEEEQDDTNRSEEQKDDLKELKDDLNHAEEQKDDQKRSEEQKEDLKELKADLNHSEEQKDELNHSEEQKDDLENDTPNTSEEEISEEQNHSQEEYITSDEEHELTSEEEAILDKSKENNDIRDEDYDCSKEDKSIVNNTSFEVLTTKPSSMVKDDNFQEFIDTTVIDNMTEEPLTTTEDVTEFDNNTRIEPDLGHPELVVSVVTTKSVVNNTIIPSITPAPTITLESGGENSTDTWVVVASVQTSRSVSGARYLPSPNVEQDEKRALLNEELEEIEETTTEEIPTTTLPPTTTKSKTSTESLIDKLDRVQSDLSSSVLNGGFDNEGNNIAVITENMTDKMATTMLDLGITTPEPTSPPSTKSSLPVVQIRKFSPLARPSTTHRPKKTYDPNRKTTTATPVNFEQPQGDEPPKDIKNSTTGRSSGIANNTQITVQDVTAFLPPGYKNSNKEKEDNSKLLAEILGRAKLAKQETTTQKVVQNKTNIFDNLRKDDLSGLLLPSYKPPNTTESPVDQILKEDKPLGDSKKTVKIAKQDDISGLLPPGYKNFKTSTTTTTTESVKPIESLLAKAKPIDDISSLLPPGYKPTGPPKKGIDSLLAEAKPLDVSAFLPPGYKSRTTQKPLTTVAEKVPTSLLPPGYRLRETPSGTKILTTTTSTTTNKPTTGGFKVVFPSRPGGGVRKSATRLTTPRATIIEEGRVTGPTIQKGWPSRATTEFTGWPTPSTTPISIEKLLEAARTASSSTTESIETTTRLSTTTTTTTTTTTPKPTTPGVCEGECDLAGTIKLIGGAKWVPELLDRNTNEWQLLANEVQVQLEDVFSSSSLLNKWYKKIRIDGFSEGSVLVDYLVELNDLGRQIDTLELKKLFHESLDDALANPASSREAKALNNTKLEGKLSLGRFIVDPKYTDFVVLPKQNYPTVGYAEDNVLLPQWAIAVIVIGLASLLFVIIFGVTVLVNRQKNAKKKAPIPLTEDMLNELNKNHMSGFDNYGADDLYNMEDVWNDRAFEPKLAKKRSSGSIHDNSMSNLYDSWRSEWNGFYYNNYYGNNPGSSHGGYGRRRSDYDSNF